MDTNITNACFMFDALSLNRIQYVHLPLILSRWRKLSKRHGATSVKEFIELGYTKDGLKLPISSGWSLDDKTEDFTLEELEKVFDPKEFRRVLRLSLTINLTTSTLSILNF